jgi:Integrase core domain
VLFDRLCRESGIGHLLTAPRSPTTTGKVERFHRTVRAEFLLGRSFASLEQAQAELDLWITHYNERRPHQGIGMVAPLKRFELASPREAPAITLETPGEAEASCPAVTRRVGRGGRISLCGFDYHVGSWLAGETVQVALSKGGLVEISHRGVLLRTHARRHPPSANPMRERRPRGAATPQIAAKAVLRMVDVYGFVSFAGTAYHVGKRYGRQQVEVRLSGESVEIWKAGTLLRRHAARHDPSKEHGAFATPRGRPRKYDNSVDSPESVTELLKPICNTGGGI